MRRPTDDDIWDDVIRQVQGALQSLDPDGDPLDENLLASVRAALDAAFDAMPPDPDDEPSREDGARVVVLEGGRAEGSGPRRTGRPDLRVAGSGDPTPEGPTVRMVRVTPRIQAPLHLEGHIDLHDDAWQTLFRGPEPRAYRVACVEGTLDLAIDGTVADRVAPGQTVDVEARLIRVRAADARATGRYARIS